MSWTKLKKYQYPIIAVDRDFYYELIYEVEKDQVLLKYITISSIHEKTPIPVYNSFHQFFSDICLYIVSFSLLKKK